MIDGIQMGDIMSPEREEEYARLIEMWRGFLEGVQQHHSSSAAIASMMLVAMQAQEKSEGSEWLAEALESFAASVRSKRPADGGSSATH